MSTYCEACTGDHLDLEAEVVEELVEVFSHNHIVGVSSARLASDLLDEHLTDEQWDKFMAEIKNETRCHHCGREETSINSVSGGECYSCYADLMSL